MRRGVLAVLVVASAALAEERKVTSFVELDAARLARGAEKTRILDGALVLEEGAKEGAASSPAEVGAFDRACLSVNAVTPGDSSVEVLARPDEGPWLSLGHVATTKARRSVVSAKTGVRVETDTIELPSKAKSLTVRVVLRASSSGESPRVRRVAVVAWPRGARDPELAGPRPAWGRELAVGERSQRVEDPKISGRICSPTSLSMVLAFHGIEKTTREVADAVLDHEAGIYGNWAFNVAFAGQLGLSAHIGRFASFAPLEDEIAAGRPVVITHRWKKGELEGAPIESSDGHLIVVRGFTKEGDVIVNDPCADPKKNQAIRRVYKRADIARTWLGHGDGVCYVVRKEP